MKRNTVFFIIAILVIGGAIFASARLITWLNERRKAEVEVSSSDAVQLAERVRIAADGWSGYAVLRSPQFRRYLEAQGIGIEVTDDKADYGARMAKLAAGEYDMVVATLDTYLLNARQQSYPGVIVFVIDESRGGDGIVASKEVKTLNGLAAPGVRIALTPNSPSDFLLRAVASHFDLAPLKVAGDWRVETTGSEGALKSLRAGAVQAAVLWEPELSEATADGSFQKLFTTQKTEGLIVDVCIVRREFVVQKPKVVEDFVRSYFQSLRFYMADRGAFEELVAKDAGTTPARAKLLLDGIAFATLTRNAQHYFGVVPGELAREELLSSLRAATEVLVETRLLPEDPLKGDYKRITNSSFVAAAYKTTGSNGATSTVFKDPGSTPDPTPELPIDFPALGSADWEKLSIIGTLRVRPIYFQSGTAALTDEGAREIEGMAKDLALYPRYRLLVRGHTSIDGDTDANVQLSQQRADAVAEQLSRKFRIPPSRIRAMGVGGAMPLPQEEGESDRRWKGRLPRVEVLLVEDPAIG